MSLTFEDRWAACTACGLCKTRKNVTVGTSWSFGDVTGAPLIMVVGEAPGPMEDETGIPFVGPSGQILREEMLKASDVRLAYIVNSVACRPPGSRPPTGAEINACAPWLLEARATMAPAAVLAVGRVADAVVKSWALTIPSVSVVHPAALIRAGHPNDASRKTLRAQVAKIKRLVQRAIVHAKGPTSTGCAHKSANVGAWMGPSGAVGRPIVACIACGLIGP